jgi:UDP-N-acetylglucosamine:LPS N-acetylglucosamine transferase
LPNLENINIGMGQKRLLVAPLDWGLGHATRCIPLINKFLTEGFTVVIAADGPIANLLKEAFPNTVILRLPGYEVTYPEGQRGLRRSLLGQWPRVSKAIKMEQKWLANLLATEHFDAVISDNRYGLYHPTVPCVFITHQLMIQTGSTLTNTLLQRWHYRMINRFSACWVPDTAEADNLSGKLAHPKTMPAIPVAYIGPLSRMKKQKDGKKTIGLCIVLSGPEPQRTYFEKIILEQLKPLCISVILVRGLPNKNEKIVPPNKYTVVHNHLPGEALSAAMQSAEFVLCRSGYSSVMDLVTLACRAILVPTPEQTEQEYLAESLKQKQIAFSVSQQNFNLAKALNEAQYFTYTLPEKLSFNEEFISKWLHSL